MATKIERPTGGGFDRDPHPKGVHAAVCCDVYTITKDNPFAGQKNKFGKVNPPTTTKLYIGFLTNTLIDMGDIGMKNAYVSYRVNPSFGEKSNMRPFMVNWLGDHMETKEIEDMVYGDMDALIGKTAMINVVHRKDEKNGKTYVDVASAMPLPQGMTAPSIPADFKRHEVREAEKAAAGASPDDVAGAQSIRDGEDEDPAGPF